MSRTGAPRRAIGFGMALLAAAIAGPAFVVVLGATALAVVPADPRDRAAPSLTSRTSDPLRITVLGTSLSSSSRYRWPDEVGVSLARRIGRAVEVRRVAQPGATSSWGADQVDRVLETEPDVVLVELAINDADVRNRVSVPGSLEQHERTLAGLGAGARAPVVVLLTMNPATGPRAWARPFLSRYYAGYVGLAERYDTGLVDLYARWCAVPADGRDLPDGLHPTDSAASSVIVEPVVDVVARATTS